MKENDLAKIGKEWIESKGYEVYSEVLHHIGTKRADMICVKDDYYINIETKMSMNLTLFEQTFFWKDKVHESYLLIPSKRKINWFGIQLAKDLGVGILIYRRGEIIEHTSSSVCKNPDLPQLYEQQKNSNPGTKEGGYVTPFKITKELLIEYIKENDECSLLNAIKNIDHHYSSNYSAKKSLHKLINIGVVEKLEIFRKGKEVWVKYLK